MSLENELEAIYYNDDLKEQKSFRLFEACIKRLPNPEQVRVQDYLNEIHKIEGSWKLFCIRHSQYRPEGFRDFMMEICGDILSKPVLEYLQWK